MRYLIAALAFINFALLNQQYADHKYFNRKWFHAVCVALPTLAIMTISIMCVLAGATVWYIPIVLALCCIADVVIVFNFIFGIATFAVAYLFLAVMNIIAMPFVFSSLMLLPIVFGAICSWILIPYLDKPLRIPMIGYLGVCLIPMVISAFLLGPFGFFACWLLLFSDVLIAMDMVKPLNKGTFLVLATYYVGLLGLLFI